MKRTFISTIFTHLILVGFASMAMAQNVEILSDNAYPPYSYEKDGKAAGIYADILHAAFAQMDGYQVTIKPVPWKRGVQLMKTGKGFALYPPYYRPKTRPFIDCSVAILDEGYSLLGSTEFAAKNLTKWPEDFKGVKIGINTGFSIPKMEEAKKLGVVVQEAANAKFNLLKLGNGRIDGYINDTNAMLWQLKQLKETGEYDETKHKKLQIISSISEEQGYLGFSNVADANFPYKEDFVSKITKIIEEMKASGKIQSILDSYIK